MRLLLFQTNTHLDEFKEEYGLLFHKKPEESFSRLRTYLDISRQQAADLIVFPELALDQKSLPKLQEWSKSTGTTVIAGSHYHHDAKTNTWISRCPVIIAGSIYFIEKTTPSPYEISPIEGRGLVGSQNLHIFTNSPIGNFAVLICADYLSLENRTALYKYNLDFVAVIAWQGNSDFYHSRMNDDALEKDQGVGVVDMPQKYPYTILDIQCVRKLLLLD